MSLPNNNPLKRLATAGITFVTGLVGMYIGYMLMDTMISALAAAVGTTPDSAVLTAVAWLAYILLCILAVIVVPVYELFSITQE